MTPPDDDILELLAAYALDTLEPEEIAQVSALLEERPELRATLAELRATASRLPYGLPEATPTPDLRQRVLDRATGRAEPRSPTALAHRPGRMRAWLLSLGGLAAVAIVAAAIGWGQLAAAQASLAQAQQQLADARASLAQAQQQLATAEAKLALTQVQLTGDAGQAKLLRVDSGETIMVAQLPQLPPGRVYQLWRIEGQSAPASAGIFTVDQQGYGAITIAPGQPPRAGETFAVSNEPDGGSPGPTTEPIILGTYPSA
jgi:anti-sigma-K factor RskA